MTSEPSIVRSSIEGGVKVVRESCCDCVQLVKDKKTPIDEFIATGIGHSQCRYSLIVTCCCLSINSNLENIYNLSQLIRIVTVAIDYLNEPANGVHRVGAIAIVSLNFLPLIHIWNCPA